MSGSPASGGHSSGARVGGADVGSALFIDVEVDDSIARDRELATTLEEVCPVDIFRAGPTGIEIVTENLDECVLCGLCLNASPPGTIRMVKLYDGGAVLEANR